MRLRSTSERAVVLTGAGATRGAYLGIGGAKIRPPLNSDFFAVAERFVRTSTGKPAAGAYRRLADFIDKEMRLKRGDRPTMEQVYNVLFISKELPEIFSRGGRPRDAGFRREIVDFFRLTVSILRYVQSNPRHPRNFDHHARLARALDPGDCIISLNYDTLVDNALTQVGWDPREGYGFSAAHKTEFRDVRTDRSLRDVLLLKPHGSLNWYAKGTLQTYEDVLTRRPPSRLVMSSVPRAYDITKERMVRFFIPPLYAKFFANPFWRQQWQHAFERLVAADVFVVIGCSLIETDFHLRSIVGRALARRRKRFRRILIAEPSDDVVRKLKQFLRGRAESGFTVFPSFTDLLMAETTA